MPPAIETLSIKSTTGGGTSTLGATATKAALGDRLGQIINVKTDFGAVGDNFHDDTANIQAALDAAYGSSAAPHNDTNNSLNKPVYFPAGEYKVTAPLYLTYVQGAWIFGAGAQSTRISYSGSLSGNTVAPATSGGGLPNANTITPIFMTNGFRNSRIEQMQLSIVGANTSAFYLFQDGAHGGCSANTFSDLLIVSAAHGILAGYQSSGLCSEVNYNNVTYSGCGVGLRVISANALNHCVFGGGGDSCTVACYQCDIGQINVISGASLSNNTKDIVILSNPCSIIGGRTESTNSLQTVTPLHVSGFTYQAATPGTFVTANSGGMVKMDSCVFNPNSGAYVIAALSSTGIAVIDNCVSTSGSNGTISGSTGAKLWTRGCVFSNASTTTGFTGAGGTLVVT